MSYKYTKYLQDKLPTDIIRVIEEYANPLYNLQELLNNKDEILKQKMWNRMIKHVKNSVETGAGFWLICNKTGRNIIFNKDNIHTVTDTEYVEPLLYGAGGYHGFFFFKTYHVKHLCGLDTRFSSLKYHMRKQLQYKYPKRDFKNHTLQQLYYWWRKL